MPLWKISLFSLTLTLGVSQCLAAQTANRPFADLGRYFNMGDMVVVGGGDSGTTPEPFGAPSLTASVFAKRPEVTAPQERPAVDSSAVASLSALSPRVKPGDTLFVRVMSGEDIVGTLLRASASSLTMVVGGQPREISASAVQQVVLRRGRNRFRLGLLIGAPIGAVIGQGGCYRVNSSPYQRGSGASCGASVLGGAVIGAAIGALIGSSIWRPALVYPTPPAAGAVPARVGADALPAFDPGEPLIALSALSSRVLPFETIYVRNATGEEIVGGFWHASAASLTVEVDGHTREIAAGEVQRVWRRGANRVRKGMLFGFITGATAMNLAFAGSGTGYIVPATVVGGGAGLMWGALIGAFLHERPLVYRPGAPTVLVLPVLAPDRTGVMASFQF
jgi:hypothetical protein